MTDILAKLGLTKELVRESLGVPRDKPEPEFVKDKNYLAVEDQKRIRARLKSYSRFIYIRYKEGFSPKTISHFLGVSEESVRSRLRKAGCFNTSGPGRPKSKS